MIQFLFYHLHISISSKKGMYCKEWFVTYFLISMHLVWSIHIELVGELWLHYLLQQLMTGVILSYSNQSNVLVAGGAGRAVEVGADRLI